MIEVFADTSGLTAFIDGRDRHHQAARRFVEGFSDQGHFLTTDFVVSECLTLVKVRCGHAVASSLGRALRESGLIGVRRLDDVEWEAAWDIFDTHNDKEWSFVDCTSFAFMDHHGINTAFAFDEDFRQRGLRTVPQ